MEKNNQKLDSPDEPVCDDDFTLADYENVQSIDNFGEVLLSSGLLSNLVLPHDLDEAWFFLGTSKDFVFSGAHSPYPHTTLIQIVDLSGSA